MIDPGIGFGKSQEQNIELIARLDQLISVFPDLPLLVGPSRKSFIGKILADDAGSTLAAGGKRMRPLLVLLCAGPSAGPDALRAATAIELVHMATLVHDDVPAYSWDVTDVEPWDPATGRLARAARSVLPAPGPRPGGDRARHGLRQTPPKDGVDEEAHQVREFGAVAAGGDGADRGFGFRHDHLVSGKRDRTRDPKPDHARSGRRGYR